MSFKRREVYREGFVWGAVAGHCMAVVMAFVALRCGLLKGIHEVELLSEASFGALIILFLGLMYGYEAGERKGRRKALEYMLDDYREG